MSKSSIEKKKKILEEFTVPVTVEISSRLDELQDDDIALERYVHTLIKNHLFRGEE